MAAVASWLSVPCTHACRSVRVTASTTGPIKRPTIPKAIRPPITPARISRKGRSAPFFIRNGRIMLSMRIKPQVVRMFELFSFSSL